MNFPRIKRLIGEATWVVSGQCFAVLGSLVLVRVLTEYLSPTQYGELALGLTFAALVNQAVMGGVVAGIGRYFSVAIESRDIAGYLYATHRLMAYATAAAAALGLVSIILLVWIGNAQWIGLVSVTLVFSLFTGYSATVSSIQSAARQRSLVAVFGGLDAWLRILLAVAMTALLGVSSVSVMAGYALSSVLVTGAQYYFLRRSVISKSSHVRVSDDWERRIWAFAWPISVFGIFTWMQLVSDRWALHTYVSIQELGLYSVVFQLGYTPIGLITGMAMSFMGPILYQRAGDAVDRGRNMDVHRLVWVVAFAGISLTGITFVSAFLLHEWIFGLLVAPSYREVSYLLPWIVLAGGVFSVGQMFALKLMSEMRPGLMSGAKIVTAILGIGLNIVGAAKFGLLGVVWALVTFSCIYFLWMAWLATQSLTLENYPAFSEKR
jgi:O-antigen/teichoic acid export membrane protein